MQNSQLDRLLKLASKTGDKLIVTDLSGGGEPVVIVPLDQYESLLESRTFRRQQKNNQHEEAVLKSVAKPNPIESRTERQEEVEFDQELVEEKMAAAFSPEEPEVIPVQPLNTADDTLIESVQRSERRPITRKVNEKEGGEERFYLEPVS